jgi:hypothetical protein
VTGWLAVGRHRLRALAFGSALTLTAPSAAGQTALTTEESAPSAAAEIGRALRERLDAYRRGDADAWGRYVADDCLCGLSTKAALLAEMRVRPAGVRLSSGAVSEFEVRFHGDVAAVRYRTTDVTEIGSQRVAVALIKAETYVRRDGRWLLIGGAETIMAADPPVAAVDPGGFDALVGRYQYGPGVVDVVSRDGSRLLVQAAGQQAAEELFPENATTFFLKGQPWRYVFVLQGGSAASVRFRMYGHDLVATRIDTAPPR